MTVAVLENELKTLPETERVRIIRGAMQELSPATLKALERQLRRFAHPDVPEDVWIGFEEAEDGRGIEVREEHFERPPVWSRIATWPSLNFGAISRNCRGNSGLPSAARGAFSN
jgi:hypothetical protein